MRQRRLFGVLTLQRASLRTNRTTTGQYWHRLRRTQRVFSAISANKKFLLKNLACRSRSLPGRTAVDARCHQCRCSSVAINLRARWPYLFGSVHRPVGCRAVRRPSLPHSELAARRNRSASSSHKNNCGKACQCLMALTGSKVQAKVDHRR